MSTANFNEKVKKDFLNYASAVIKSRAISSVEDNLKPVHRRILHVMGEEKLWSNKKTVKSANVVGKTMIYHPHGDASIYDAMVRLAQPWKMRYPLVEMQGNIGSILGDGPAAARYTEARLSKFGEMMLEDINKNAVPFKTTYDDTGKEPFVLPSRFPNILCNGNSGIAVGLSSNLVPHNLSEVVDGIIAYLDAKNISVENLMKYIPAPDFPTGGTITDSSNLLNIYSTGSGTITLRGKYRVEEHKSIQHIVFYEVPYLVNIEEGIIEPLKKLVVEDGFDLIDDYANETNQNGVSLRIILKKGANIYKVLDTLWKNTRLQITQRVNNTVLIDGNPKTLSLKDLIRLYVNHRHNVIINVSRFDLEKVENRVQTVKALMTALERIDEVIDLIKKSLNTSTAKIGLIHLLGVNEFQAQAILDMKLSKLSKLDNIELEQELAGLLQEKTKLEGLVRDLPTRELQIKKELLEIKNKYKDERRTTITNVTGVAAEDAPSEPVKFLIFENGNIFITQQKLDTLGFGKKGTLMNQSAVKIYRETKTDATMNLFMKDGSMQIVKMLTLGIETMENIGASSGIVAAFDFNSEDFKYLVFVTKNGLVKRTLTSEYADARNNTKSIKLKEDDELVSVIGANDDTYIYLLNDRIAKFLATEIPLTSRLTIGSKGIIGGAKMGIGATEEEKIFSMNNLGQAKLTLAHDFNVTAKGGSGQVITENTIFISPVNELESFIYSDKKNNIVRFETLSTKSKTAVGAKLVSGTLDSISI